MHVQTDGPEKTNDADVTIAAHAICVRTTMLSLASNLKGSQVFKLQDEHNASSFFLCLGKSCRYPNAKLVILLMFRIIYNGIIA